MRCAHAGRNCPARGIVLTWLALRRQVPGAKRLEAWHRPVDEVRKVILRFRRVLHHTLLFATVRGVSLVVMISLRWDAIIYEAEDVTSFAAQHRCLNLRHRWLRKPTADLFRRLPRKRPSTRCSTSSQRHCHFRTCRPALQNRPRECRSPCLCNGPDTAFTHHERRPSHRARPLRPEC